MEDENKDPIATPSEIQAVVEVEPAVYDEIVSEIPADEKKHGKHEKHEKHEKKHKIRKLCKLVKKDYLEGSLEEYKALVVDSKWVCRECGRASNDPARLHAPVPLERIEEEVPEA